MDCKHAWPVSYRPGHIKLLIILIVSKPNGAMELNQSSSIMEYKLWILTKDLAL